METGREKSVPLPEGRGLLQGRYKISGGLGAGGFGITYRALDTQVQAPVAIKELYPRPYVKRNLRTGKIEPREGKKDEFEYLRKRFREEAEVIHSFQESPEILNIYNLFDDNGTSYYAMELLEGENLQKLIRRKGKFSWHDLREIVWPLLDSIRLLHERSLIHRDISPDNIFVQKNGGIKLIDFGSVRNYAKEDHFTTILKEHFAPPEQEISKSRQGPQTDIYALSATLYYALSGVLPVKSAQRMIGLEQGDGDGLASLRLLEPSLPDYVADAVEKGMSLDFEKRFSSVQMMKEALFPGKTLSGRENLRWIACIQGQLSGGLWAIKENQSIDLGRGKNCTIKYSEKTPGISWCHCSFFYHESGKVYLKDNRSTYGTYVNGKMIIPGRWYPVDANDRIRVGMEWFSVQ